jgi:uncharacterized protein (DUF488 family)
MKVITETNRPSEMVPLNRSEDLIADAMNLFTLGYQGTNVHNYISTLRNAGVGLVVDVRETAWSHKRDFCKSAFKLKLELAGIQYIHLPSAGNPKQNRKTAKTAQECLDRYRVYLSTSRQGVADILAVIEGAQMSGYGVCLTCFEREPLDCHRSILADAICCIKQGIRQVHLLSSTEQQIRSEGVPEPHDHEAVGIKAQVSEEELQGVLF